MILRQYLSSLDYSKKRIVFFDELPWMETHKSHFLDSFEWFWNSWGSKQDNLIMIVSGSATSWMNKKISDNKAINLQEKAVSLSGISAQEIASPTNPNLFDNTRDNLTDTTVKSETSQNFLNESNNDQKKIL